MRKMRLLQQNNRKPDTLINPTIQGFSYNESSTLVIRTTRLRRRTESSTSICAMELYLLLKFRIRNVGRRR